MAMEMEKLLLSEPVAHICGWSFVRMKAFGLEEQIFGHSMADSGSLILRYKLATLLISQGSSAEKYLPFVLGLQKIGGYEWYQNHSELNPIRDLGMVCG